MLFLQFHGYDSDLFNPDFWGLVKAAKSSFNALYRLCEMCPHLNFDEVMAMVNEVESISDDESCYSDDSEGQYYSEKIYARTQVWF